MEWGKIMYKFENKMLPKAFDSYFKKPTHHHATRYAKQGNFEQVRTSSVRERTLLQYIGPKIWSEIPLHIKKAPYLSTFKNKYQTHLTDAQDE